MLNFLRNLFFGVKMDDQDLHQKSLKLAAKFRQLYATNADHREVLAALEAYTNCRRQITTYDDEGKRIGARQAFDVTQGHWTT